MRYFIVERYDYCNSMRLVFSSDSIEETVKTWYQTLKGKDLYFDDGWCDQAIISYKDGKLTLTGFATEGEDGYAWNLHTYDENTKPIYDYAVNGTPNYYSHIEKYKEEQKKIELRQEETLKTAHYSRRRR